MAIYHASMTAIQRSTGRSSVAAAAYRAGEMLLDESTGCVHDYTRKRGVVHAQIVMPGGQHVQRGEFWSRVEKKHTRKDATTARELEISLPCELSMHAKIKLAVAMAEALAAEYGVAADVCVHAPSGDERNWHAHILMSACAVKKDGTFGNKVEVLDPIHCARRKLPTAAEWIRPRWEKLANEALELAGKSARIDHRSYDAQGITAVPSSHLGPAVSGLVSRGENSHVANRMADQAALKAATLLARQVLNAEAAETLLAAQAQQAQLELEAELEAQAAQEAVEAAERAKAAQEAQERAQAWAERDQAAQAHARAQAEVEAAERARQALWPAYDRATVEQRQAGESLFATAMAIPKISGWQRAIEVYEKALGVLAKAQAVLAKAGERLAAALARLEAVDPAVREAREAREKATRQAYEAQQSRIAKSSADAASAHARGMQRGSVFTAHHQVQDDQERGPDDVPRM